MTTAERMKMRRKELGLSAEYLAKVLDCSPATIYRYEKGDIEKMPINILEPIAKALSVTPAYLMGWESIDSTHLCIFQSDENRLIHLYRQVNSDGQKYIIKQAEFASVQEEYQKTSPTASGE